jgi:hypothetical protein
MRSTALSSPDIVATPNGPLRWGTSGRFQSYLPRKRTDVIRMIETKDTGNPLRSA